MDKTHCANGHELTSENIYTTPKGHIQCKECRRQHRSASYRRTHPMVGKYVPPQKTHCIHGHEFTPENTYVAKNGDRHCKACKNETRARFRENHPEKCSLWKKEGQLRRLYGIQGGIPERDALLAAQGNACAFCGRTDCTWKSSFSNGWAIDHDHDKPGTHRGVLCASDNTALGKLEPHMLKVIKYLMYWKPGFADQVRELVN